jgi:predicted ATPase/transcriptional regulator with XRE-family HTH domain
MADPDPREPFGALLRRLRQEAGLTQEELAERAGLSVRGISDLERGVNRTARRTSARLYADALGLAGAERRRFLEAARGREQPPAATNALPIPPTPLIGRQTEVATVLATLTQPGARLVTLTGPGGTGKTRLALEVAHRAVERFPAGVYFVELAPLAEAARVTDALAQTLGIGERPGQSVTETIISFLSERRRLLVMDNFEHLLAAAALVASLIARCPGLTVLVTSRTPLHLRGEQVLAIAPLPLPEIDVATSPIVPAAVRENEAVTLFVQRARAVRAEFALSRENAAEVVAICRRLDGLPLAIELVAARTSLLSPAAIVRRLSNRLDLLTGGARDRPRRHQTLRNAIDWSYQLLSEEERTLFRTLGVFAGGATLDAIAAVYLPPVDASSAVIDQAATLVEWGLLRQETQADGEPRLRMLETIREYAVDRLAEHGEEETARRAHARYFLALAERAEPELVGAAQATWLAVLDSEQDNLRGALTWAIGAREAATSVRLAGALWWFWETRGYFAEGQSWLERALAVADDVDTRLGARVLFGIGALAYRRGDLDDCEARLTEALAVYRATGDASGAAWCLAFLGLAALVRGQAGRAEAFHEEALHAAREAGDRLNEAGTLSNLGEVAHVRGERERAAALYEESLQAARSLPNHLIAARSLTNLAVIALESGRPERAAALHRAALQAYLVVGDRRGIASSLEGLAATAATKRAVVAARIYGAAAALRRAIGSSVPAIERECHERGIAQARARLGEAAFHRAWSEGYASDLDDMVAEALELGDGLEATG